ncbi:MAG TPA: type II secretion system F family protein [Pirellulales bacterium]|jgi:type II secretory pathway component PulF|nr:type II secretion system F family protein [Pirellulales bacterium]
MPTFRYTAREGEQMNQSGHIEAIDVQDARAKLESRSLTVLEVRGEATGAMPTLSTDDATELLTQIGEIVKAGLPLAAGLRAMQADLPRGKFARAVGVLAEEFEAGTPLDVALTETTVWLPTHLRGMLAAGVRSGRLAAVLQESLAYEQLRAETGQRLKSIMAYPVILLVVLAAWLLFVLCVVPPLMTSFDGFSFEEPAVALALLWLSGPGKWVVFGVGGAIVLVPILLWLVAPTFGASWLLARLPLVGPLWRSRGLVGFCNLLSTLLDQSIPLPTALELTANSLGDGELKAASRRAAKETAAGKSLSQSVDAQPAFPRTLKQIVHWGEQVSAQSEALRSAANLYRNRMELQIDIFRVLVPPMTFVAVALTIWLVLTATILPMLRQFGNL